MNIRKIKNTLRTLTGTDIVSLLKKEFRKITKCEWHESDKLISIYHTASCLNIDVTDPRLGTIISKIQDACIGKMKEMVKEKEERAKNKDYAGAANQMTGILSHAQDASILKTKFFEATRDMAFMEI